MAIGERDTQQYECRCGTVIPASEAEHVRSVPPVEDGGEIQPYPYGSMKARPYNFRPSRQDAQNHPRQLPEAETALAARPHPDHNEPSPCRWHPQAGWPYHSHDEPSPGLSPRDLGRLAAARLQPPRPIAVASQSSAPTPQSPLPPAR